MKWPLIGSAAGHLALLAFLLLFLRVAGGPGFPGAVQVVLVEAGKKGDAPQEINPARVPGGATLVSRKQAAPGPDSPAASGPDIAAPSPSQAVPGPSADVSATPPAESLRLPERISTAASQPVSAGGGKFGISDRKTSGMPAPAPGSSRASPEPGIGAGNPGAGEGREISLLRERIESRIVYPEEAVRRGQEGEVLLRIRVGEGGVPREIRIARSSGTRALDEAARNGVTRAAPLPSRPGWFEVPVRFFLR